MATNRKKRTRNFRPPLSEAQLDYLRRGQTKDLDVWLDWDRSPTKGEARAAFLAIRDDYPPGEFAWAESKWGKGA